MNDLNRNNVPDCVLTNPLLNGECGPWLTSTFGSVVPGTQNDPATLSGLGVRPWNWEFSTGVQQQVMPRVSVGFAYFRRIFGGFLVTDNVANKASDFTQFNVVAPNDSRFPTPGGTFSVYDISPALVAATQNVNTFASNYGNQYRHWNGFDVTTDLRLPRGTTFSGGVTAGRTMTDNCEVVKQLPEVQTGLGLATPLAVLPHRHGHDAAIQDVRLVHAPVCGAHQRQLPEPARPRRAGGRPLHGPQMAPALGRPFSAGPNGQKTVNIYDPNTTFRRSAEPAGPPVQQDLPLRQRHVRRQLRHLQLVQLGCGAGPEHAATPA